MTHEEYITFTQDYQTFRREVIRWRENLEGASPARYHFDPLPEIVVREWKTLSSRVGGDIEEAVSAIEFAFRALEVEDQYRVCVYGNVLEIHGRRYGEFITNPNLYNELVDLRKSGDYHYPEALEGTLENLIERAANLNEPRTP